MAGVRKKGKYNASDKVDEWLLNQIVKRVKIEEIGSLARDLRISPEVYRSLEAPRDKIFEVNRYVTFKIK